MSFDPSRFLKATLGATGGDEVLAYLHKELVGKEITLADGRRANIETLQEPETGGSKPSSGLRVALDNGSYLEFTLQNTGFGRVEQAKKPRGRRERQA